MNPLKLIREAKQAHDVLVDWLGSNAKPVSPRVSQRRADQCNGRITGLPCPLHVEKPLKELFVGSALVPVKKRLEAKSMLKLTIDGEENLHVCDACGCLLKLKVHTPIDVILENTRAEDMQALHPDCWVLKEFMEILEKL
jgi:hypothetical protein